MTEELQPLLTTKLTGHVYATAEELADAEGMRAGMELALRVSNGTATPAERAEWEALDAEATAQTSRELQIIRRAAGEIREVANRRVPQGRTARFHHAVADLLDNWNEQNADRFDYDWEQALDIARAWCGEVS